MSNIMQFVGGVIGLPPTAIIGSNETASAGSWAAGFINFTGASNIRSTLSGALTANTYKEILAVTGAGVLNFSAVSAEDSTARSVYMKVLIDGVQVIERSMSIGAQHQGPVVIGSLIGDGTNISGMTFDQIPYSASLSLQIKSSLTETDKLRAWYHYRTV